MLRRLLPLASRIIKDAVKHVPDDEELGERLITIALTVLAKAVKMTKTDIDDNLFDQVSKAIRNRDQKKPEEYLS